MRIFKSPAILQKCFSDALWKIKTDRKEIYLTFDDGPHPEITPWVLDLLKDFNVKATFFCIGKYAEKNPDIVEKINNCGHSVCNHGFNHLNGWNCSKEEYVNDVLECSAIIDSNLFRPPYGKMKYSQYEALKERYHIIIWDVLSYDWDNALNSEKCLSNTIHNTKNGSIIVFHDSEKAFKNLKYVLPRYLQEFCKRGYSFSLLEDALSGQKMKVTGHPVNF